MLHGLFFWATKYFEGYLIPDSYDYRFQRENLLNHGAFYAWDWDAPVKDDYFTKRTPGYALFLFLLRSDTAGLVAQNILSILTWLLLFELLSLLLQDTKKAAWLTVIA